MKWIANLEKVTIEQFIEEVIAKLKPEILECEDTVLNFAVDTNGNQHLPRKDPEFRQMLHLLIRNQTQKFTVYPVTSSKGFSDYDLQRYAGSMVYSQKIQKRSHCSSVNVKILVTTDPKQ